MTLTTQVLLEIGRGVRLLPLALLFLVPFAVSNELMDGITTAKGLAFAALLTASIVSLSLRLILYRAGLSVTINWLDLGIISFWMYSALRTLFTPYAALSDVGLFSMMICLYFLFRFFLGRDADQFDDSASKVTTLHVLATAFLVGALLQAMYGMLQLHGPNQLQASGSFKLRGSFENPDAYAGYLASVMPFAFGLYFLLSRQAWENRRLKYLGAATFLSGLLVLPATMIRSSWLAVLAGIIVVFLHKYEIREKIKQYFRSKRLLLAGAICGVVIIVSGIAGLYALKPESAEGRLLIWKITFNMIKESPLFGVGFDRYQVEYGNAQATYFTSGNGAPYEEQLAGNVKHAHNEYLQVLAETGVVGLMLALMIVVTALGALRTTQIPDNSGQARSTGVCRAALIASARASLVAILVSSLFSFPLHILPTAINFVFLLSLISILGHYEDLFQLDLSPNWLKPLGVAGMISALIAAVWVIDCRQAYIEWNDGFRRSQRLDWRGAISAYESLKDRLRENGKFLFMRGAVLVLAGEHAGAIRMLEDAKQRFNDPNLWISLGQSYETVGDFSSAEKHYAHASYMIPHKLYPQYLLAKMYQKNGKEVDALRTAEAIVRAKEKVQTTAANEMKAEMQRFLQSARTH